MQQVEILVPFVTSPRTDSPYRVVAPIFRQGKRTGSASRGVTDRRETQAIVTRPCKGKFASYGIFYVCTAGSHSSDSTSSVGLICFMQLGCWKTEICLKLATAQCRRNSMLTVYEHLYLKLTQTCAFPFVLLFICLVTARSGRKIISTISFIGILYSISAAVEHEEEPSQQLLCRPVELHRRALIYSSVIHQDFELLSLAHLIWVFHWPRVWWKAWFKDSNLSRLILGLRIWYQKKKVWIFCPPCARE